MAAIASLVTACKSPPGPGPRPDEATSSAQLQYRKVAANHLYARNAERIYKGQLPPMLYAVSYTHLTLPTNREV